MRRFFLGLLAALCLAGTAMAQDRDPAIEGVIRDQLDAFQHDDFATAFTFASPNIKRMFGTAENFGTMVREGYPMVYRPGEVQFLDLEQTDRGLSQKVMVRDAGGAFHVLDYKMIQTDEGWQIDGVSVVKMPQVGA